MKLYPCVSIVFFNENTLSQNYFFCKRKVNKMLLLCLKRKFIVLFGSVLLFFVFTLFCSFRTAVWIVIYNDRTVGSRSLLSALQKVFLDKFCVIES